MTVLELKRKLVEYDDSEIVVMSSDAEGNVYRPAADIEGEFHYYDGSIEPCSENAWGKDGVSAVCLWPE